MTIFLIAASPLYPFIFIVQRVHNQFHNFSDCQLFAFILFEQGVVDDFQVFNKLKGRVNLDFAEFCVDYLFDAAHESMDSSMDKISNNTEQLLHLLWIYDSISEQTLISFFMCFMKIQLPGLMIVHRNKSCYLYFDECFGCCV